MPPLWWLERLKHAADELHFEKVTAELSTITFGSCRNQELELERPQPIWRAVEELKPQLYVWLGDAQPETGTTL